MRREGRVFFASKARRDSPLPSQGPLGLGGAGFQSSSNLLATRTSTGWLTRTLRREGGARLIKERNESQLATPLLSPPS